MLYLLNMPEDEGQEKQPVLCASSQQAITESMVITMFCYHKQMYIHPELT